MSAAQTRNARRFWEAVCKMAAERGFEGRYMFTVGEAAEYYDCSVPAARRYLESAVQYGALSSWKLRSGAVVFTITLEI